MFGPQTWHTMSPGLARDRIFSTRTRWNSCWSSVLLTSASSGSSRDLRLLKACSRSFVKMTTCSRALLADPSIAVFDDIPAERLDHLRKQ